MKGILDFLSCTFHHFPIPFKREVQLQVCNVKSAVYILFN